MRLVRVVVVTGRNDGRPGGSPVVRRTQADVFGYLGTACTTVPGRLTASPLQPMETRVVHMILRATGRRCRGDPVGRPCCGARKQTCSVIWARGARWCGGHGGAVPVQKLGEALPDKNGVAVPARTRVARLRVGFAFVSGAGQTPRRRFVTRSPVRPGSRRSGGSYRVRR